MLSFDPRANSKMPYRNLPFWVGHVPTKPPRIRLEEEEEDDYGWITDWRVELEDWWAQFSARYEYPLYCMIMATEADKDVALYFENHRIELSAIAGKRCCFVYFRDIERAKLLEPFRFTEHARGVLRLMNFIEVRDQMPCLLFFEQLASGEYVCVDIDNKTVSELNAFFRELFAFIYSRETVSLSSVRAFRLSRQVQVAKKALSENLAQFGKELIKELAKSLTRLPEGPIT